MNESDESFENTSHTIDCFTTLGHILKSAFGTDLIDTACYLPFVHKKNNSAHEKPQLKGLILKDFQSVGLLL